MLSVRWRRLPRGPGPLLVAALMVFGAVGNAAAFDNLRVIYGLREYGEYNDNLFSGTFGKIGGTAINTNPDVSFLYDDGKTRWLARGNYRRESFVENRDASGDYYAFSGEFSRDLSNRHTFSILGGYTFSSSLLLGQALTEPGQPQVIVPTRGASTTSTNWSPSISSFWSRRFTTTLSYDDTRSFGSDNSDIFDRSIALSGGYALSPSTTIIGVLQGGTNRSHGRRFADQQDANTFATRFGFSRVMTPRLTVELSAGPQWTKEINLPDEVTLIRTLTVVPKDALFGPTDAPVFIREPGTKVNDTSMSLAFSLRINYQINQGTRFSLDAGRSTDSGQGVNGTFEQNTLGIALDRTLSSRWHLSVGVRYLRATSIARAFSILPTVDPETGEREALDNASFDIQQRLDSKQFFFQPRLDYRFNRWWTAYLGLGHSRSEQGGRGASKVNVNRVTIGLEFRNEARF